MYRCRNTTVCTFCTGFQECVLLGAIDIFPLRANTAYKADYYFMNTW